MSDDPILNCILEVCCGAGSPNQRTALANVIAKDSGCDLVMAETIAGCLYERFDFAEKGTLQAFKKSIVRVYGARS